ncbi:ABC transporter permease [Actinomadura sp. 9N407]|uniref:ABC transporter permease n=1 Tax=Actinomadura sp. 9N407 TaxID=3375154 RepID=UPI0037892099
MITETRPVQADPDVAWTGSNPFSQTLVLAGRSLRALVLTPQLIVTSLVAPLLMLVVFSQIFAGIAATPGFPAGVRYIEFLLPAIMVNTAMQSALQTGIGLTDEMRGGIITRLRSLPVWPGAVLAGRSLAELARGAIRLAVLVVFAAALFGFAPAGGPLGVLAAAALALVIGASLGWIFIAIACWMRSLEMVQSLSSMVTFALMFGSNAFVPLDGLPQWLRLVAIANPMTYAIEAARDLTLGRPAAAGAITAVGIGLAVAVPAALIALRGFRRTP